MPLSLALELCVLPLVPVLRLRPLLFAPLDREGLCERDPLELDPDLLELDRDLVELDRDRLEPPDELLDLELLDPFDVLPVERLRPLLELPLERRELPLDP